MSPPINNLLWGVLAFGLGFSCGMALTGMPVVLEATDTPIGSFVLRGNLPAAELLPPLPDQRHQPPRFDQVA